MVTRSGTMPPCSKAKSLPVRPRPHITSSQIIRMPWRESRARNPARYPGGGIRMPFVPVTVSRIIAAIVCGPS